MPADKLPISVTFVASNEDENLKRALPSVADWVSELIVVINDCTDGTEEVAKNFGAQVYEEPWENYTVQVARAINKATQPWILVLDADEEVPSELADEISAFVKRNDEAYAGACFPRRTRLLGRWITHGDWYPDLVYRLFRTGKGSSEGAEHGRIDIDGQVARLKADLNHYSFPNLRVEMTKIAHFADGFEKQKGHKRWSLISCLFRTFWRFFRSYVLRLGFLDGFPGLYVAMYVAYTTFIRYSRLYKIHKVKEHKRGSESGGWTT